MNSIRIDHATLIAHRHGKPVVLGDHSILIDGGVIKDVSSTGQNAPGSGSEIIDASNHIVIPGLINTHHHLYQSLTRCMKGVQDAELFDWLTALYPKWSKLTYEAVRLASQISIAELLLSGCTTTSDHFYLFPQNSDVRIEAVLEAAESLGIRIHACRGSMSVGRSRGGLPPDGCVQEEKTILADCERALQSFHDPRTLSMRRIDLAPCSPFSVSADLSRETASLARAHGALLHTHAAETKDEEKYCLETFGKRPIEWLDELGWLGTDVYLAHCVHLADADIRRLAQSHTGIAHCPSSNMRLGSGIAPVRRLLDAGARIGLGVDGSSSNDGSHLLAEARQAVLLQRVAGGAKALSVAEAFTLGTLGSAAVLNRPELGNIAVGFAADLAMYRRNDIALAGAVEQDPLGALMLCHVARADRVLVNGRTVVCEGQIASLDASNLIERFNRLVAHGFRG
ncbi:MAG TPA: 8-oxoguanine deaminase [Phycisphaerae bacterium]|nr:8-oxoguanine deaminase [Phycisphaerae bacterium]